MFVTTTYRAFGDVPARYDVLFDRAVRQNFFLSRPWFESLASALTVGKRLWVVAVASQGGEPLALLPMVQEPHAHAWTPRLLHGLANYYAPLFGPIVDRNLFTSEACDALARALTDTADWDVVDLHPMDADGGIFDCLTASLRHAGLWVQSYFCFANWYLQVQGRSFEQYYASLPSILTNTLARKERQVRLKGGARFTIVTGREGLDSAIRTYEAIYTASWKPPEESPELVRGLICLLADRDWLRLGFLYISDAAVAVQLWIVAHGRASIYKLAHLEQFSNLSPGSQLTLEMMRYVLDVDRVDEVDYLTGDESYKRNWMSHRRERMGIIAFDPRKLRGLLVGIRHIGGRMLKRALMPAYASRR